MESQERRTTQLSIVVVVNIIWWMVMIAAIGLGATHLNSCPVQPAIPVYLIGLGLSSLLSLSLTYIYMSTKQGCLRSFTSACISILHIFSFCWFISGSVWVYEMYAPSYIAGEDRYCQKTVYQFAFFLTSLCWFLVILMFFFAGCFALLFCHKLLFGVRGLSRLHETSYGGTSEVQGHSATGP
ncbi:transmembrane protein 272-like [Centroberyx affinis]|uniref:transmembrane protein 272-like n=1 Tax=Centroberyx affinis TaxID=166261 RepID=UPI003A5BC438